MSKIAKIVNKLSANILKGKKDPEPNKNIPQIKDEIECYISKYIASFYPNST